MASMAKLFEEMPNVFDADKAGDFDATVQFMLTGEDGGEWYVVIAGGEINVEQGTAESPTSTIHMEASDYADMVSGELNPMTAFMQQKVRIEGDLNTVMKFQTLFDQ
jgi:putative sterol carrier protein